MQWSPVINTGTLMDGCQLVLRRDDGGTWRLSCWRRHRHLLGHRVMVEGVRCGFDEIDVDRVDGACDRQLCRSIRCDHAL